MKTVLITGANRGIGFETARQVAQLGHFVYLGSRDLAKGEKARQDLEAGGVRNVNAYTVALASELRGSRFKVNCVNPGHTATTFNDYKGTKPVAQGAAVIVKYALLDEGGPTGKYLGEEGETPW